MPAKLHDVIQEVTERIGGRSAAARGEYLERTRKRKLVEPARGKLACANLAHVLAASGEDKARLQQAIPNIGVVTSYNDMLSAHQPFEGYPEVIRAAARLAGGTAQVAGGVPAMCDGVTQGRAGMELSLFSRDVIALATAVSPSSPVASPPCATASRRATPAWSCRCSAATSSRSPPRWP